VAGVVPAKKRAARSKMLRSLSEKKKRYFYEQNLGNDARVLFENDIQDGRMHGFTENYIRVTADYDPVKINDIIPVTLSSINSDNLAEVQELPELLWHSQAIV
jgi:threonylcarbamoyladenosine tRNA methylthiotransferase MtaB